LRILTFSTLYPNAAQPSHGVFVENRIRQLAASGAVSVEVVAPVPVFPVVRRFVSGYAQAENASLHEIRHQLTVHHPRYPLIPKVSMLAAPLSLYAASRGTFAGLRRRGFDFDLIDSHYFFPDGVAAVMLGRHFGRPVAITARGTDINLIPDNHVARRMILWAARHAAALITVSSALKDRLTALGVDPSRIDVLRNGVDFSVFKPGDRAALRQKLGLNGPTLLSVGNLVPEKGHALAIEALSLLPDHSLLLVGSGRDEGALRALAQRNGVADRVRFVGKVPHEELSGVYTAADIFILASLREGWPNVLLESLACGTPVVSARVGGTPEIVTDPVAGELFAERSPAAIASAVRKVMQRGADRAAILDYARQFGWDQTTQGQLALFRRIIGAHSGRLNS
jgi:teichuronic acid biosynthesis glycosyltransferase TuaC